MKCIEFRGFGPLNIDFVDILRGNYLTSVTFPVTHTPRNVAYDKTLSSKTEPVRRTDGMPIPLAFRRPAPRQRGGSLLKRFNNRFSQNPRLPKQSWVFCLTQDLPGKQATERKMTTTLETRFEPETRFEVLPTTATFRATHETELERLKNQLLRQALEFAPSGDYYAPLRRAANEAAALAWATPFPLLFLPTLFDELGTKAKAHTRQQTEIMKRSRKWLTQAA